MDAMDIFLIHEVKWSSGASYNLYNYIVLRDFFNNLMKRLMSDMYSNISN